MSEWVLEVSEVNEYVRQLHENEPALRKVRLRGEISNFKRHSAWASLFYAQGRAVPNRGGHVPSERDAHVDSPDGRHVRHR